MHLQNKVLHLSLLLAMLLPPFTAAADSSETPMTSADGDDHSGEQVATGKGESYKFKNSGEANRLRHRVNEAEKDEAERRRLERHEDDAVPGDSSEAEQSRDRDRVQDQTRIKDQENLMDQSRIRDQERNRDSDSETEASHANTMTSTSGRDAEPDHQFDPYAFEARQARQGFSADGSMYKNMGSGRAMGGGSSSTGSRSAGGSRRGAGGR